MKINKIACLILMGLVAAPALAREGGRMKLGRSPASLSKPLTQGELMLHTQRSPLPEVSRTASNRSPASMRLVGSCRTPSGAGYHSTQEKGYVECLDTPGSQRNLGAGLGLAR